MQLVDAREAESSVADGMDKALDVAVAGTGVGGCVAPAGVVEVTPVGCSAVKDGKNAVVGVKMAVAVAGTGATVGMPLAFWNRFS